MSSTIHRMRPEGSWASAARTSRQAHAARNESLRCSIEKRRSIRSLLLTYEFDDFLGHRSRSLLGQIAPAPFEDTSANISRDERMVSVRVVPTPAPAPKASTDAEESPLGPFAALIEPLSVEISPVIRQCGPSGAWCGVHPDLLVEVSRCDSPRSDGPGTEQPSEKLSLTPTDEDLWQVIKPVEGEVPRLHVRLRRGIPPAAWIPGNAASKTARCHKSLAHSAA